MKAISIWQPFATLVVKGFKVYETRTWAAPQSVIGQRIGIASTRSVRPEQRAHFADAAFMRHYDRLCLPDRIEALPLGFMLGTVVIDGVELMTPEFMDGVGSEEKTYGWWEEGFYAWRLIDPVEFETPIMVKGAQGLYSWSPPDVYKEECVTAGS